MKHHSYLLYWLLIGPYYLLRLLAGRGEAAWTDCEDDILVVCDVFGREAYLIPDRLSGAKAHADPHVGWNEHKWRQMDEAMWPLGAWTPAAEGVQHVLFRRPKLGKALCGYQLLPAICDSS